MDNRDFSALSTRYKVYIALGEPEKAEADNKLLVELLEEE
jgi:hypothetical protein